MELEWKEPPPPTRGKTGLTDWDTVAEQLKSRPGEWALILRNVPLSTATNIKNGSIMAFRDGKWNAAMRRKDEEGTDLGYAPNRGDLYVTYLGEEK